MHSAILVCHDVDTEGTKNVDGSRGSTEGKEKKVDGSGVRVMYMYMYVCMYIIYILINSFNGNLVVKKMLSQINSKVPQCTQRMTVDGLLA